MLEAAQRWIEAITGRAPALTSSAVKTVRTRGGLLDYDADGRPHV